MENDYPIEFIFNVINSRIKSFIHQDSSKQYRGKWGNCAQRVIVRILI